MPLPVDTRNPAAVRAECTRCWQQLPVAADVGAIHRVLDWLQLAFAGRDPAFEPLDTPYHDLEHTLQGTLCLTRLFVGWHACGSSPRLDARAIRLGLTAVLLHDTGYLKDRGDHDGTGAKFTRVHVHRSTLLAEQVLRSHHLVPADILAVQSMIRCTAVNARPAERDFESELHLLVGCALGTADLLGQMAADDYPEKLPLLHAEFAEAAAADGLLGDDRPLEPVADLIRETPVFWRTSARPRLDREYRGLHRFLNDPWPAGPNEYLRRIERNLARIEARD